MSAVPAGQTPAPRPTGASPSPPAATRPCTFRSHTPPADAPTAGQPETGVRPASPARAGRATGSLVVDSPFAAVPEWVIDAAISDTALRLYCVLLRYGNTTGHRMPSRATLAARLHKKSTDTIDRALRELEALGALAVEHRATGTGRALTNRYHLLTARPGTQPSRRRGGGRSHAAAPKDVDGPPPVETAPPPDRDGRTGAAPTGRTSAAGVAAPIGQDRKPSTQTPPHPTPSGRSEATAAGTDHPAGDTGDTGDSETDLLQKCGITDLRALIGQLHDHRRRLARPITPWSRRRVLAALHAAVTHHGWPPDQAGQAVLAIAADRHTTSPMRLTAPGPWWNAPPPRPTPVEPPLVAAARPEPGVAARGATLARAALHRHPSPAGPTR